MMTPQDDGRDRARDDAGDELAQRRRARAAANMRHVHAYLAPLSEADVLAIVERVEGMIRRPMTSDEMHAAEIHLRRDADDPYPPERLLSLAELEAVLAAIRAGARTPSDVADAVAVTAPQLAGELRTLLTPPPIKDDER